MVKQEDGNNSFEMVSDGIRLLVVNDFKGNFMPVLDFQLSDMHFEQSFDEKLKVMIGRTYLTASLSYFNTPAGRWEPAIEQVNMNFELTKGKV